MTDNSNKGLGSDKIDPQTKHNIQSKGGQVSSSQQDMSKLGEKGGKAAQESGHAHELTQEERSEGGSNSGGNFKNNPDRAAEAGSQSHKND